LYAAIENGVATAAERTATPIMETAGGAGQTPRISFDGVANKTTSRSAPINNRAMPW
jgi:hypothetical protein